MLPYATFTIYSTASLERQPPPPKSTTKLYLAVAKKKCHIKKAELISNQKFHIKLQTQNVIQKLLSTHTNNM